MNKLLKKMALMIPQIRKYYINMADLRRQNESLKIHIESLENILNENNNLREQNNSLNIQIGRYLYMIEKLDTLHEDVVESTRGGNHERKQWICMWPFSRVQIDENGDVLTCCTTYLKQGKKDYFIGNIFTNSFDEIWNSDNAKKLRYSVSQGNFEYCTKKCPQLNDPSLYPHIMKPRKDAGYHYDRYQDCHLDTTPTQIMAHLDSSCNLYCPSCRHKIRMKSDFENEKVNIILQDFIRPALKNCKSIVLDGCGEFLASKSWERFLKTISKAEFPSLELIFFTNGQLFTPERWEKFSNLKGMPISVGLSIDAASKDVYEELRRGGKWETLCRNMEYISSLKASGDVVNVTMRFVVQKKNIHQLEDFVLLGKKWNVDTIRFQRLGNYGTFSESEYFDSNVFSQDNPLRAEAVRIMTKLTRDKYEGIKIYEEGCLV